MPNRQELEQAIITLEAKRLILGEEVVDVSLSALRRKLGSLQSSPVAEQYGHIVILVADLSGYTVMSEMMDAEELRDTINAVWERLDAIVEHWGGEIDKHVGDGIIALFGVPKPQPDDAERAILAALDMQMELALYNQNGMRRTPAHPLSQSELRMRIGIDSGLVFFGKVGISGEYTALGDAVSRAIQLQRSATVGGTLISKQVFSQTQALFELEAQQLDTGRDEGGLREAYLVKGENPHAIQSAKSGIAPGTGRVIGRQSELEHLQRALQAGIDSGRGQFLTIIGEAGVGKSRLLAEFEQSLKFLPTRIGQFRGQVRHTLGQIPYALLRQMFLRYFGIHRRSRPVVAREKLAQGIMQLLPDAELQISAYSICHLLGYDFSDNPQLKQQVEDACRVRAHAYEDVVLFLKAVCRGHAVVTLLLEDLEWADEKSLDLLDHIYERCQDQPLLIVCTGRPSLYEKRPSWQTLGATSKLGHRNINLAPLSVIDSRHLIAQSLPGSARPPLSLIELILEQTHGNPAQIAQFIQLMIESEVIIKDSNQWRVQREKLADGNKLPAITTLLRRRLKEVSALQRTTLQRASVVGHTFWKSAVLPANEVLASPDELEAAMKALQQQGVIYSHSESEFAGTQEYSFLYDSLCKLAYESLTAAEQRRYHAETAAWLIVHSDPHISEYASLIASHLEKAGEIRQAAEWFSRAGTHAKAAFAHETAIKRFRKALTLLPDGPQTNSQRVKLNETLGELLRWQARLTEAITAYREMHSAACLDNDHMAEAAAMLGTFMAQISLGDHAAALATSQEAEQLARALDSPSQLSMALAAKAWALIHLDDLETSLDLAQEALAISTAASSRRGIAYSNALIGGISRIQQWYEQAAQTTEKALALFRELGDVMWEALMLGNLGHIAYARHDYDIAVDYYQSSLHIARDIGDQFGVIRCLRKLGEIALAAGIVDQTAQYYQKAFIQAEKSRNIDYCAQIAVDLGWLYLGQLTDTLLRVGEVERDALAQQAQAWLERALFFALKLDAPLAKVSAQAGLARLLLEFMQPEKALDQGSTALDLARKALAAEFSRKAQKWVAICWRVIGLIASELPPQELPIMIDGRAYDAAACFYQSLYVLTQMGRGVEAEFARSLQTWASYELSEGDHIQGQFLWSRARDIFYQIGMENEADLMDQIRFR